MSLILDALRRYEGGGSAASAEPALPEEHKGAVGKKRLGVVFLVFTGLAIGAGWIIRGGITDPKHAGQVATPITRLPFIGDGATSQSLPRTDVLPPAPIAKASVSAAVPAGADLSKRAPLENNEVSEVDKAQNEDIAALHEQMWADAKFLGEGEGQGSVQEGAPISGDERPDSFSIAPPVDLVAAMQRAARQLGEPNLVSHPTVLLENLSQQQKDKIPTISYTEHIYAENPSSSVELNGQRLRLGERMGSITVEEVLVDSVILSVNGITFRLRALNTWLNL